MYQPGGRTWFILDSRVHIDHIGEDRTASVDLEAGRALGSLLDAVVSGYLRPGIGISGNRPYDWNLEVGLKVAF